MSAWADIPASAYVQDGLVVQFDGIENAGAGTHDDAAATWKDLSGNGRDGAISGSYAWLENGLQINSVTGKGLVKFDGTHTAAFTLDVCLKVDNVYGKYARITAENATPAMCCYGGGSSLGAAHAYVYGPKDDKDLGSATYNATVPHTSTLLQSGTAADGWDWYHDGALLVNSPCAGTSTGSSSATLANRSTDFARGLDGTYYAVRLYNRKLTPQEIAWNAMVDHVRFSGKADDCRYDETTGNLEVRAKVLAPTGGKVSLNGAAPSAEASVWVPYGSTTQVTLEAVPDEGATFVEWIGDIGAADAKAPSVTVTLKASMTPVLARFRREGDGVPYIRRGLMTLLDGIDNAGVGQHVEGLRVWKDLAGDFDLTLTDLGSFADGNALSVPGGAAAYGPRATAAYRTLDISYKMSVATGRILFESACTAGTSASSSRRWVMFDSNGSKLYADGSGAATKYVANTVQTNVRRNFSATYGEDSAVTDLFADGASAAAPDTMSNGWGLGDGVAMIGERSRTTFSAYAWTGLVYGLRLYSVELTPDEIAYNAALDRVRFDGANPDEVTWPDGYKYDAETGRTLVRVSLTGTDGAQVSEDGESWSDSVTVWCEQQSPKTFYARPAAGSAIGAWQGLPVEATLNANLTQASLTVDRAFSLTIISHKGEVRRWRGGTSALASDVSNWTDADGRQVAYVPLNGDSVQLDGASSDLTWDLGDVKLSGWTQTADYAGTVTFRTGRADNEATRGTLSADGKWREVTINGDVTLAGGTWTHEPQPSLADATAPARTEGTGVYRLIVRASGNFNLATNSESGVCGMIDVTAKGFLQNQSPGNASHGGQGTGYWGGAGNRVYGKVKQVRTIGSSSSSSGMGGGNVELHVGGSMTLDGHIRANGGPDNKNNGSTLAGGGVWITAGALSGAGDIIARAEIPGGGGGAGGGRISVMLTKPGATFDSFTGRMSAHDRSSRYNAGTIYLETADQNGVGDLLIRGIGQTGDGNWWATSSGRSSHTLFLATDDPEDLHFHNLILTNGVQAAIGTNTTVVVDGEVIGDSAKDRAQYTFLCMRGGTLKLTNQEIFSNITFRVYTDSPDSKLVMGDGTGTFYVDGASGYYFDRDLTIEGSLHVLKGGRIQQAAPLSAQTVDSGFRCNLNVTGDVTIDAGGSIDVTGEGTPNGYGFWGIFSEAFPNGGGFHAANAPGDGGAETYGSIFSPTNLGSGGKSYYGGGAIRLFADGTILNNGSIRANGSGNAANVGTGAGGSIWLRAAKLLGTGDIEARGGDSTLTTDAGNPGAGGRIALELTDPTAAFADYEGTITARGGAHTNKTLMCRVNYSGAGTVLCRTAADSAPDAGLLVVDNETNAVWATTCPTMISGAVTDHTVRNVKVANGAWLSVARGETLTVTGDLDNRSANISPIGEQADATTAGGTVAFADAARESRVTGTNVFTSLIVTTPGKTVRFGTEADSLQAVAEGGAFTLAGEAGNLVQLRSVTDGEYAPLKLMSGAAASVSYADVKDSDARYGLTVVADAETCVDSKHNENWKLTTIRPGDPIVWTGDVSGDWTDPTNWDLGRAPVDTDVITVSAGGHDPVLSGSVAVNRLVVAAGATLDLAGYDLTVTNGLDVAGTLLAANSTLAFAASDMQEVALNGAKARTVVVAGGVTFTDAVEADTFSAATDGTGYPIFFPADETCRFKSFLVDGVSGGAATLVLASTEERTRWNVNVSSKGQVSGVTVIDSAATGIALAAEVPSADGGNNDNWIFGVKGNRWSGEGDGKTWANALNWTAGEVPDATTRVVFEAAATVSLPAGETAVVRSIEFASEGGLVTLNAGDAESRLAVAATFEVAAGGNVELNVPTTVGGAAFVRTGGLLSHSEMGSERSAATAWKRIDLTVDGDLTVEPGGEISAVRKGYNKTTNGARIHGGRLSATNVDVIPAYGSVFHPVYGGTPDSNGHAGGGVIRLQVAGTLTVDGTVTSGGYYYVGGSGTAGGSLWITVGALAGAGLITAEGGKRDYAGGSAGTGGRVAIYLTTAAGTNAYTGAVTAKGGSYGTAGSLPERPCGTVYWQFADEDDYAGTIVLDNAKGSTSEAYTDEDGKKWTRVARGATDIPAGEEGDDPKLFKNVKLVLRNYARAYFTADMKIGDIVVEDKSDVFMNGHDVEVLALDHKKRKGWSKDAFVFNPERSNETPPKLGRLHWRLPGLLIFVK